MYLILKQSSVESSSQNSIDLIWKAPLPHEEHA